VRSGCSALCRNVTPRNIRDRERVKRRWAKIAHLLILDILLVRQVACSVPEPNGAKVPPCVQHSIGKTFCSIINLTLADCIREQATKFATQQMASCLDPRQLLHRCRCEEAAACGRLMPHSSNAKGTAPGTTSPRRSVGGCLRAARAASAARRRSMAASAAARNMAAGCRGNCRPCTGKN